MKIIDLQTAKKAVLELDGLIIQNNDSYFKYMMPDNSFGYVQTDSFIGLTLASVYKPSKENGTGARYPLKSKYTNDDILAASHYRLCPDNKIQTYKDLKDFLKSYYFVFNATIETKQKKVSALSCLKNDFIFVMEGSFPTINSKESFSMAKNKGNQKNKKWIIFKVEENENLSIVETNIKDNNSLLFELKSEISSRAGIV